MATEEEWKLLSCRRRSPAADRAQAELQTNRIRPYVPYHFQKTFAQVVTGSSRASPPLSASSSPKTSPPQSRPASPPASQISTFYTSPHSPTTLRFPPSASYPEWHNICFRCCRFGYPAAKCGNQLKCGRCWQEGHVVSRCWVSGFTSIAPTLWPTPPQGPNQSAQPVTLPIRTCSEPGFTELFNGDAPKEAQPLPDDRPDMIECFIERYEDYFHEIHKLSKAVVISSEHPGFRFDVNLAVRIAVNTGLVTEEEIRVAKLSGERYLVHLPRGLEVDTFIKAISSDL